MVCHGQQQLPCLHCQPNSHIRMVQNLIERCLLFHMTRDDCIQALAKHAGIQPVVTLTVWEELLKENKGFFQAYFHAISPRPHFHVTRPRALHAHMRGSPYMKVLSSRRRD
ncbi:hypothetical protein RJ639_036318 [Escallonia herrerae]|uniref:Uncharacterized protein n=1 Tax=Escallonia herrerae TaxID=1293975 RepID=A0AA88WSX6_9ASTE|nr:hypothetical protein RJ639_036318 [Escallonia herrerae]